MASSLVATEQDLHELLAMLFGAVLEGGAVKEITWEDAPKMMARLERAGFVVRGEMLMADYGRAVPVISVELKIKIKEFPRPEKDPPF